MTIIIRTASSKTINLLVDNKKALADDVLKSSAMERDLEWAVYCRQKWGNLHFFFFFFPENVH